MATAAEEKTLESVRKARDEAKDATREAKAAVAELRAAQGGGGRGGQGPDVRSLKAQFAAKVATFYDPRAKAAFWLGVFSKLSSTTGINLSEFFPPQKGEDELVEQEYLEEFKLGQEAFDRSMIAAMQKSGVTDDDIMRGIQRLRDEAFNGGGASGNGPKG